MRLDERDRRRWFLPVGLSIVAACPILAAAAFFNGAPLLYADSIDYLLHGSEAVHALFTGEATEWWSTRSFLYALAILPLHLHITAWPIVAFHAAVTAWVLYLTLRTTLPRYSQIRFLAAVALLTAFTSVSWFVSYVMPDLFAALLLLAIQLLCFQWRNLARGERIGVVALTWFAIVSHTSHALIAGGMIPVVAAIGMLGRRPGSKRLIPAARLASVLVAALGATLLVNAALMGNASLSGRRPPFLLARVIADGTAAPFLDEHCDDLDLALCAWAGRLPDSIRDVLWSRGSVWGSAPAAMRERLRKEELAVVIGSIRNDPGAQLSASAANFWNQLITFGYWGSYYPDPYIEARIDEALPRYAESFYGTRQGRQALHEAIFGRLHTVVVVGSLAVIVLSAYALRRRIPTAPAILAVIVGLGVVGNAAITGILSNVEERYQSRVVWLIPLLAFIAAATWADRRRHHGCTRTGSSAKPLTNGDFTRTGVPTTSTSR
jgi:hypothetical protein